MFDNKNNYTLRVEQDIETVHYFAHFTDGSGQQVETEITEDVARAMFRDFVRQERNLCRSDERNTEQMPLSEEILFQRVLHKPELLEDSMVGKVLIEELYQALKTLSDIQRRRLLLYYFENLTLEQISNIECCSPRSVFIAIKRAKEGIKKFL